MPDRYLKILLPCLGLLSALATGAQELAHQLQVLVDAHPHHLDLEPELVELGLEAGVQARRERIGPRRGGIGHRVHLDQPNRPVT